MSVQRPVCGCPTSSLTFPGRDSRSEPGHRLEEPRPYGPAAGRRDLGAFRTCGSGAGTTRRGPDDLKQRRSRPLPPTPPVSSMKAWLSFLTVNVEAVCLTEIENQIIKRALRDGCPGASNLNVLKLISFLSKNSCFADIRACPCKAW